MKIALFSDFHGNIVGLRAVLEAVNRIGDVDVLVSAGDLIGGSSGCAELLDTLLEYDADFVKGNAEELFLDAGTHIDKVPEQFPDYVRKINDWQRPRFSDDHLRILENAPIARSYELGDGYEVLGCHASPDDPWNRVCASHQPAGTLREVYGCRRADLVAYGHYHRNHVLSLDGKLLVNVASVGFRTDGLCMFSTVEFADGHVSVVQQSVWYDAAEEDRLNRLEAVPLWHPR